MRQDIEARLAQLKEEQELGLFELEKCERQRAYLKETVLRIEGAILALEELVTVDEQAHNAISTENHTAKATANHTAKATANHTAKATATASSAQASG